MADMQEIGTELYNIVVQVYPELAPKLTGMLLQLGQEECIHCLESQEQLAMRLDEAFAILDTSGQCAKPAVKADPNEKRVDPEDGKARTLDELRKFCQGQYSPSEIDRYWEAMKPLTAAPKTTGPTKATAAPVTPAAVKPAVQTAPTPAPASRAPDPVPPAAASKPAAVPAPKCEALPGLAAWLAELKLTKYADDATEWVAEMGACTLDEIIENLDDFAESVGLKPLERKRVERDGEAAIKSVESSISTSIAPVDTPTSIETSAPETDATRKSSDPPSTSNGAVPRAASYYEPKQDNQDSASRALIEQAMREQEELDRERAELEELERADMEAMTAAPKKAAAVAKAPSVRVAPKGAGPKGGYSSAPAQWGASSRASAMADAAATGIVEEFPALSAEVVGKKGKKKR